MNTLAKSVVVSFYLAILVTLLPLTAFGQTEVTSSGSESNRSESIDPEYQVYLPLLQQSDRFSVTGKPIWVSETNLAEHEVGLFRKTFTLSEPAEKSEIRIFADTRYEVFLDGVWVGRGPARFSLSRHEYDVYLAGSLQSGEHTIAVLVQWAPNNRRSESVAPFLQAHVWGISNGNSNLIVFSDETWKAIKADAWNSNSILVHSWGLIGPTELVDLRLLPQDWQSIAFDDSAWLNAVHANLSPQYFPLLVPHMDTIDATYKEPFSQQGLSSAVLTTPEYAPRSIELLENYPISMTLIELGTLSPARKIIEFSNDTDAQSLSFDVLSPTLFSVELLSSTNVSLPSNILLDGSGMFFYSGGEKRPDVIIATRSLETGSHTLVVDGIPLDGLTLSVSTQNIEFHDPLPFMQGDHAGRRLLLAEPVLRTIPIENDPALELNLSFETLPAYAVIDLGRTIHGRASFQVEGSAGIVVDLGWDERLYPGTQRPLPFPGSFHPQWNQVDSWILDGTARTITTIDARAGRYLLLAVWGENDPVDVLLKVNEERYPVVQHGYFDSSNDLLDQIWQVGVDTTFPNMTDAYADPWRERGQWWGDAFIDDRVNRVAFGDFRLLKRGLLYMAGGFENGKPEAMAPNGEGVNMADYAMLWLQDLEEYLRFTEDHAFARDLYPTVVEFMNYLASLENPLSGLLDFPEDTWARTVYIDTLAWMTRKGQSTPVNAMYSETLRRASYIAEALGEHEQANLWQDHADYIQTQLNSLLYLPDQDRYITGIYETEIVTSTLYAQAWPLAYGIVTDQAKAGVVNALQELISSDPSHPNIGTYGMYWVLEGLGKYGYIEEAIDLIELYYSWMLSNGATTWWESFTSFQDYRGSLSHGWSSSPTWFLSSYVLGAKQTDFGAWRVKPSFSGVDYASGAIPIQTGLLSVSWEGQLCDERLLDIQAPPSTSGKVIISDSMNSTIYWNANLIWDRGSAFGEIEVLGSDLAFMVPEGQHHFEISDHCLEQ